MEGLECVFLLIVGRVSGVPGGEAFEESGGYDPGREDVKMGSGSWVKS